MGVSPRPASRGPFGAGHPAIAAGFACCFLFAPEGVENDDSERQRRYGISELRVNGAIRAKEVRVVAPDGEQIGVKKINEALWLAEQLDLDLVEVAPNARPPVCRLMDYGRYKYEQSVKQREARKKQTRTTIKELRMRVRIGEHDFEITERKAREFLEDGDKVKVNIRFRGRERERPDFGRDLLNRLADELSEYGAMEQTPKLEGGSMTMVLAPVRRPRSQRPSSEEREEE
jgi:translation initiation factor IF-3